MQFHPSLIRDAALAHKEQFPLWYKHPALISIPELCGHTDGNMFPCILQEINTTHLRTEGGTAYHSEAVSLPVN